MRLCIEFQIDINSVSQGGVATEDMISLLQNYVKHLREVELTSQSSTRKGPLNYYMPADSVSPDEWAEFDNVYQVHCPRIYMDNIIRDVSVYFRILEFISYSFRIDNATILLLFTNSTGL